MRMLWGAMEEVSHHPTRLVLENVDIQESAEAVPWEDLWRRLEREERIDVLEAGCGAGRFTEVLLGLPGAAVTSTDLSAAVEPNQGELSTVGPAQNRSMRHQCASLRPSTVRSRRVSRCNSAHEDPGADH